MAPASPFSRDDFDAGVRELQNLGFDPVYDDSVFARRSYVAGDRSVRAAAFRRAWTDESIRALMAVRGGYGSVQILPLLDADEIRATPKVFIGYSDNTSLLAWLTTTCGLVSFHGPMLAGRFARGESAYDRSTFERVLSRAAPAGVLTHQALETIRAGEAAGILLGGTLTQLVGSLSTPFAFNPPDSHILFVDEVAERPYKLDRMLTQLQLSGLLGRAAGIVFGELPECDEPGSEGPTARAVVADFLSDFPGPVVFGLPSGHTRAACMTLPFGVRARIIGTSQPALVIEEAAVA